jgi:hypothetical protein
MRIVHRISLNADRTIRRRLTDLGVDLIEAHVSDLVSFDVAEPSELWDELQPILKEYKPLDISRAEFSSAELAAASHLKMVPSWHWDYPKPDDSFGYLEETYNLNEFCFESGLGKVQMAPFRVKGEPKWGKNQILQLHWVYDVHFALPEVWQQVFKPLGIESMPVLCHRTGAPLKTVVQLVPQGVATSELELDGYPYETCRITGKRKYLPITRGFFPKLKEPCSMHYFHSLEYFGSGASAFKAVLISNELYQAIRGSNLKGVIFNALKG